MKKVFAILLALVMMLSVAALADNLEDSKAKFEEAVASLKTTDNHDLLAEGLIFEVPAAAGDAEALEELEDTNPDKWHFFEYLDWDTAEDSEFPASPADGCIGKHVICIVHGAHAWTTCYQDAFKAACDALGMTVEFYDPNWDVATQDA